MPDTPMTEAHAVYCDIGGDHDGPCVGSDERENEWGPPEPDPNEPRAQLEVCEPGCCEGCSDCMGLGLGCHNRPASRLMAEVRRLATTTER